MYRKIHVKRVHIMIPLKIGTPLFFITFLESKILDVSIYYPRGVSFEILLIVYQTVCDNIYVMYKLSNLEDSSGHFILIIVKVICSIFWFRVFPKHETTSSIWVILLLGLKLRSVRRKP